MGAALNSIIATAFRSANASPGPGARFVAAKNARQDLDSVLAAREQQADLRGLQIDALNRQAADQQATRDAIGVLMQPEPDYQAEVAQQYGLPVDEGIGGAVTQEGFNQYAQAVQNQIARREAEKQDAMQSLYQRNPELAVGQLFADGPEWSEPVMGGSVPGGDPSKAYQYNNKTGKWATVGGGGTSVTVNNAQEGDDRLQRMALDSLGETQSELARAYSLSRQRVSQLVERARRAEAKR